MGVRATLVASGAPIAWVDSFEPEVVSAFKDELREAIRSVRTNDSAVIPVSESDFVVALAWYFLVEGWEVKFLHTIEDLEPARRRCVYFVVNPELTNDKELQKKLLPYARAGNKVVILEWEE